MLELIQENNVIIGIIIGIITLFITMRQIIISNQFHMTTILRKIYCPLYTQIMDELLIMTDYKQCSFVVF